MKQYILVLTNADDESAKPVIQQLENMGEKFYRFNTENFPAEQIIKLSIAQSGAVGFLKSKSDCALPDICWENIKSVWYRRPVRAYLPHGLAPGYVKFIQEETSTTLWSLYTCLDALWVNPPLIASRLLEHNKLYQAKVAAHCDLKVPDTLITNDHDELVAFCRKNGGILAVKRLKANFFTKEGSNIPLFVFTQKISEDQIRERAEDITLAPILAQEYIEKKLEFRVTIVGRKIFACAIHSQDSELTKHDWRRYDFTNVKHESYQLPGEVEEKLLNLMEFWGLSYGAIDMVLTPAGEYIFLEINPNGEWDWIEKIAGMQISETIAELLANPPAKTAIKIPLPQ